MANFFTQKHNHVAIAPISIVYFFGIIFALYFLFMIREIILLVFMAFILMVALGPVSRKLQKYLKLPQFLSVISTYILFVGVLAAFIAIIVPPLLVELGGLVKLINIPAVQNELIDVQFSLSDVGSIVERVGTSLSAVFAIITSTFSGIFTTFTLLVMSFFMLQERERIHWRLRWFTNDKKHIEKARLLVAEVENQLGGWVRGQLILMLTIGSLTYIGLLALSVPYALPLAILAGLLEMVPNIGPTIAAVPAVIIAYFTLSPIMALAVLVLTIVIQQLENNFIVPKVMNDNAHVSPLVSIVSILIGVKLGGVLGALLAVPIYILIRTVYMIFFYKKSDAAIKMPS